MRIALALAFALAIVACENPNQQCADFVHDLCNRAQACGGDFNACTAAADKTMPGGSCDNVHAVDGRFDDCLADIKAESCADVKGGAPPHSCDAVTFSE